ncbi:T9SS type A sorting domain-containing protein [Hymenobacter negativus]|uniref:Carboxylesterase family protein n=1 Tax=Hymenobacter negativus TaxID=2795026 RepID=A0ABS3QQC0_9BACT|nr:T9SS type A sorting domain-containing protein [Hymenobacter negativus]MBO2012880.1 carboxylesterase family protein [Hymenobacter negativus]
MRNLLLLALFLMLGFGQRAAAQVPIDTTGGRYFQPIFPNVTMTPSVVYGSAVGIFGTQSLLMDIYQPTGDATTQRPVIIFAHQGGFVTGTRTESYMASVCTQFARLGYVTASIDYRLNPLLVLNPSDTTGVSRAAIRGMQDLRAAVRFFREDAATTNSYRVSPSRIVVGGASAGGFMALEVGYLDKLSEAPTDLNLTAADIEGSSGHPGYSSQPLAVLNLSGASNPVSIIEAGNVPLYSAHGTADAVVPYLKGRVGAGLPPKYVFGSGRLNPYASSVGVPNVLRRFSQAPHIPQYPVQSANTGSAASASYADTTYRDIRAFLRPLLAPFALPSLVITTNTSVPGGAYQDITINSGQALLLGNVTVYGTLVIKSLPGQPTGSLNTNCFVVDGPGNFDLQAGAGLRICDPAGIAASGAAGAIRNTGTRSFSNDASYAYEGTDNQLTGSGLPSQVREFEVNLPDPFAVTLANGVSIRQRFLPTQGRVNNSQALVLLSGANGTALVTPGVATLRSDIVFERYLAPSANPGLGYRHLALPFDFGGFTSINAPVFAAEFNPAYNTATRPDLVRPFPNIYVYDQSRALTSPATSYSEFDKGWAVPVAPGGALTSFDRGQGFIMNISAGQTLSINGPLTRNNEDITVALPAAATPTAGWHLLGNPFPSGLNWDAVPIPAGMGGAMYVFVSTSQYAGQYRAYVNGMGGPGSTIPLGQGFFVRSLANSPVTLTFPLASRITDFAASNTATVQRPTADLRPCLHLTLATATPAIADEAILYLEAGAFAGPDLRYDAVKLPNSTGLNLGTLAAGEELAINGLPLLTATTVVPLALTVPAAGAYTLHAEQLLNFAPGTAITLTDALTGTRTLLAVGTRYAFNMSSYTAPGRFALELRPANVTATNPAQLLAAQLQVYPNPATERLQVELPAGVAKGTASAWLTNSLGQMVRRQQLTATSQGLKGEINVRDLAPGVYQLHLTVAGTPLVRKVVVE